MIDYARMNKLFPRQKAALTRAVNTGEPEKVLATTRKTIAEWDDVGAWPDDWARWQRAIDDTYSKAGLGYAGPRMEAL